MALVEAKCTNCGAKLEVDNTNEAAICPSCGSAFVVEKAINNITNNVTNENTINATNVTIVQNESIIIDNGVYEGETKSGKPHGYGVCQYSDGSRYEGNWLAGVRYGEGTITYENGTTWKGDWKNDKPFTGNGTVFDYESRYYVGDYKNGKANGTGTFYYDNGKKWSGTFNDDKEWIGEGYFEIKYLGKVYQTFEGKINDGKPDEKGEWHCNGHFVIDGTSFDVTNDLLNYVLSSSAQIVIPNGVKKVDKNVRGLDKIRKIICPKSLKSFIIDDISQVDNLEFFEAPGIKKVPDMMFMNLCSLKTIKFENATSIGEYSFEGCDNLASVHIPKAKIIMQGAFNGCNLSKNFNIPCVERIEEDALSSTAIRILIAPKLKVICDNAFSYCEELSEIKAPLLEEVGPNAFRSCSNLNATISNQTKKIDESRKDNTLPNQKKSGCYIATCVYGSYDCPQVWILRRFRDSILASTWYGKAFIRAYYAVSPTLVKWFGKTNWFKNMWRPTLDRTVRKLHLKGVDDTPYEDK